ncbi:Suppressor of Sensor Kinase (SLN1) [Boothiomyces sp. JEL0866]|nr:Suppressor of Sensor Kinase (SLN1) [Boothiomyces sp. JEL0866]
MKTIFQQAQEYLQKDPTYKSRSSPDALDIEIEKFCLIVHANLNGETFPNIPIPSEDKDPEFVEKYPTYTITKFLGKGQAGSVFLGESDDGEPLFAIKIIQLGSAVGVGLPRRRTFLIYQNLLQTIQHDYINPYIGWTVVENEAHVYTRFCNDGQLFKKIHRSETDKGIKDMEAVRKYTRQITEGLFYLHSHGIVHRDIKTNNILMHNGDCFITDLGSARLHQPCCDKVHQPKMSGTAAYCPPEAVCGKIQYEHSAEDIWSLGCCVYEMVLGKVPWEECDNTFAIYYSLGQMMSSKVNPLLEEAKNSGYFTKDGISFLEKCLAVDSHDRPTSHELLRHPFINLQLK